jgi:D-aspartate ligase
VSVCPIGVVKELNLSRAEFHLNTRQASVAPDRESAVERNAHALPRDEKQQALPAVVILGGEANALSVARDLGQMGVKVYAVGEDDSCVRHSRHATWISIPRQGSFEKSWAAFLLGSESDYLRGSIVLSCSDAGLQVLIQNRDALLAKYRLDDSATAAQLSMLDKLATYKNARAAGVPVPLFWEIATREQLVSHQSEYVYPLLVKPRLSHVFEAKFGRKHVTANNYDELDRAFTVAHEAAMDMVLMELIPGGDERLCSYYTYLDEAGKPLFHFTKRIIRRYPAGMGTACYHVTDWIPEIAEPSQKLFDHVGLRGLANIEYKRDDRDGKYKLIECNARFTASNCLVSASGFSLARFVYNRLAGRPQEPLEKYKIGLRLWDPIRDFWAYRELSKAGQLSFGKWIASILHRQTWQFFRWSDPMPTVSRFTKPLRKIFKAKK